MSEPLKILRSSLDLPTDANRPIFIPSYCFNGEEDEGIPDELVDKSIAVILYFGNTTFLIYITWLALSPRLCGD